jgi:hypothetical protein
MSAVEKELSSIFSAVPALSLVEPVIASGPVWAHTTTSARVTSGACGFAVNSAVNAPACRARASAPAT